jgi:hypothetical protein
MNYEMVQGKLISIRRYIHPGISWANTKPTTPFYEKTTELYKY